MASPSGKDPRGSRIEIAPAEVLAAVGKTPEQIREILDEADDDAEFDAVFGG